MNTETRAIIVFTLAAMVLLPVMAAASPGDPAAGIGPASDRRDGDWDFWSHTPHMCSMALGNVGIGGVPPTNARLYVKTRNPMMDYAIYAEGGLGLKAVATIWEGTGITGEGGHAGVCGNGYIGILGWGVYGGWFEGNGYFSGALGVGVEDPENALHVNGAVRLEPMGEPAAPATGFVIYCDSADGALKAKSAAGRTTNLAEP